MKIIYFDGVCGLCNGFVDFILKIDTQNNFQFSPLQSEYAKKHLPAEAINDLSSVVVEIDGQLYHKGKAVAKVFEQLGGGWKLLALMGFLPAIFLDHSYDLVAQNRYRLFGKRELPAAYTRRKSTFYHVVSTSTCKICRMLIFYLPQLPVVWYTKHSIIN